MNTNVPKFFLQWKGRQSGPYSLSEIQRQLADGLIHRSYQINASGQWHPLGEYMEQQSKKQRSLPSPSEDPSDYEETAPPPPARKSSRRAAPPQREFNDDEENESDEDTYEAPTRSRRKRGGRSNRSLSLLPWAIGGGVLLLVGLIAVMILSKKGPDRYATTETLNVHDYLENANSLRGNVYKITGTIDNQLAWTQNAGKLYSVKVETSGSTELIPVLVPANLNNLNLQKGQRFIIQVEVDTGGLLKVKNMEKS